jgi:hypothetical protein
MDSVDFFSRLELRREKKQATACRRAPALSRAPSEKTAWHSGQRIPIRLSTAVWGEASYGQREGRQHLGQSAERTLGGGSCRRVSSHMTGRFANLGEAKLA